VKQPIDAFLDHFGGLEDRREAGKILHPLPEILLVTLCGVLAGAEGFEDIEDHGESKAGSAAGALAVCAWCAER
jgi:DDE_Tnp_1-associated